MEDKRKHSTALDKTVDLVIDGILAEVEAGYDNPLIPFEMYAQQKREEAKDSARMFRMRLRKGYLEILYALVEKKNISEGDKRKILKNVLSQHIRP